MMGEVYTRTTTDTRYILMKVAGNLSSETLQIIKDAEKRTSDRRRAEGSRVYEVKELRNVHHEVLRLAVLGLSNIDISKTVGITKEMVSVILNSEVAKRQLQVMQGNRNADVLAVREQIANLAPLAVETLQSILQNENSSDRNKIVAAVDILDRGGYAAPKVIEGHFLSAHLTAEDIERIKERARQNKAIALPAAEGGVA